MVQCRAWENPPSALDLHSTHRAGTEVLGLRIRICGGRFCRVLLLRLVCTVHKEPLRKGLFSLLFEHEPPCEGVSMPATSEEIPKARQQDSDLRFRKY